MTGSVRILAAAGILAVLYGLSRRPRRTLGGLFTPTCNEAARDMRRGRNKTARRRAAKAMTACRVLTRNQGDMETQEAAYQHLLTFATKGKRFPVGCGKLPSRGAAWDEILSASGVDPADLDTSRRDAQYACWRQRRNCKKPPPREGGETDAINETLGLRGRRRVSGVREGFERLTRGAKTWDDVRDAVDALRDVPALERLRVPPRIEACDVQRAVDGRMVDEFSRRFELERLRRLPSEDIPF